MSRVEFSLADVAHCEVKRRDLHVGEADTERRIDRGLSWDEVVDVLESPSAGDLDGRRRAAAGLRKRFDRLRARLREQAEREGWSSNEGA